MDTMRPNRTPKPNPYVESGGGLEERNEDYGDSGVMFVDEIEDDGAWVMDPSNPESERQFVPLASLPKNVKDGDYFTKDGRIMPARRFDSSGLMQKEIPAGGMKL